jgi:tripartite-type tricarboxylate transporter receptor subunit TctC
MPETVIARLSEGLRAALESDPVAKRYAELGSSIRMMSPSQTKIFIEDEQKVWWPIVKELSPQ